MIEKKVNEIPVTKKGRQRREKKANQIDSVFITFGVTVTYSNQISYNKAKWLIFSVHRTASLSHRLIYKICSLNSINILKIKIFTLFEVNAHYSSQYNKQCIDANTEHQPNGNKSKGDGSEGKHRYMCVFWMVCVVRFCFTYVNSCVVSLSILYKLRDVYSLKLEIALPMSFLPSISAWLAPPHVST